MPTQLHDPAVFSEELQRVFKASCISETSRACLAVTRDREQAITLIREAALTSNAPLYHFTVVSRRRYVTESLSWEKVGQGIADPSEMLQNVSDTKGGGIFIVEDCLPLLRDDGGERSARMTLSEMLAPNGPREGLVVVFVEPPEAERHLPKMLADQIVRLDVPYPRVPELAVIAREEIASIAHKTGVAIPVENIKRHAACLADALVSCTRSAARDALRDVVSTAPNDMENAVKLLTQRKVDRLSRELSMNVLDTTDCENPIGLDYLVEYLQIHKEGMRVSGKKRTRGILLVGPPGTGKTMLAKAIGRLVDLPVVEFRISALMNSLLGETETRFAQAFATLEAMAPNVVFIDEIEKAFGDSSERDGGTMMRCTGALLSWLSDNPYPNYIVATCNSLSRMGEIGQTMTRSERFDTAFFVDIPSESSRAQMLERWLRGVVENPSEIAAVLVSETDKFSGADLYSLVKQATQKAEYSHVDLTVDELILAAKRKQNRVNALYEEFSQLRRWGTTYCDPAEPIS